MAINTRYIKLTAILAVVLVIIGVIAWQTLYQIPRNKADKSTTDPTAKPPDATPAFNKSRYSLDTPDSPWVIANKQRPLPNGYEPDDLIVPDVTLLRDKTAHEMRLRQTTGGALKELFMAAEKEGFKLLLASGYRSQSFQKTVYENNVAQLGQATADRESARPGYSEHQTGLAADIGRTDQQCMIDKCFGATAEGIWLKAHAHEYGFVMRYPENQESTTGYIYEPWHFRYVGKDLAHEIHQKQQTLEEFFDLPAAPNY